MLMSGTYEKESTLFPSHKHTGTKDFKLYCYHTMQITIFHNIKLIPGPELPVLCLKISCCHRLFLWMKEK